MKQINQTTDIVCREGNTTAFLSAQLAGFVEICASQGPLGAAEYAGECGCLDGNWNIWGPLIDKAERDAYQPECLDPMRDDVDSDNMSYLKTPLDDLDECF